MRKSLLYIFLFLILITGCKEKQKTKTLTNETDNFIFVSSQTDTLETGMSCCYLNSRGDTIVPTGKYRFAGKDTIKKIGFVLDQTGFVGINNSGEKLFHVFICDNGPDKVKEGLFRIQDDKGMIGFADTLGNIVIEPRFAFAFPFENGKAKVTFKGKSKDVPGSNGEYHYWESDDWYYLTKKNEIIAICE